MQTTCFFGKKGGKLKLLVVGIAASAGGLQAILELLEYASCHESMCFVILTHLARFQETRLPKILGRFKHLKTKRIYTGLALQSCYIYVLPENAYATLDNDVFILNKRPSSGPNNCADVFFESLARSMQQHAIGVVLSGSSVGADGSKGVKSISRSGGKCYAQDPDTALRRAMPELAIKTECIDKILTPGEIGRELSLLSWVEANSQSLLRV